MVVYLKLFASLRVHLDNIPAGTPVEIHLPENSTLLNLFNQLKLPENEVKICFVNGRIVETDQILTEGDEIGIFPPIGGG